MLLEVNTKASRFYRVIVKDHEGKILVEDYNSADNEQRVSFRTRRTYKQLFRYEKKYGQLTIRVEPATLRMVLSHLWGKTKETEGVPFPDWDNFKIKEKLGLPPGWGEEEETNRRWEEANKIIKE